MMMTEAAADIRRILLAHRKIPCLMFTEIELVVADGVATITLDRPDALNAITPTMLDELNTAADSGRRRCRSACRRDHRTRSGIQRRRRPQGTRFT